MARKFPNNVLSFIGLSVAPISGVTPFTVAAWFNSATVTTGTFQGLLSIYDSNAPAQNNNVIGIQINTNGKLNGFTFDDAGTEHDAVIATTASNNTWYAAIYSCASTSSRIIYQINASTSLSASDTAAITYTPSHVLDTTHMGHFADGTSTADYFSAFNGSISEVAIWSAALTSAEASAFGNGARAYTIRPGSLKGYWPLDGIQSPEPDLSGSLHSGTVFSSGGAISLAFGPPTMMFTPRWPIMKQGVVAAVAAAKRRFPNMPLPW